MVCKCVYLMLIITFLTAPLAFAEEKVPVNACKKDKDCVLVIYNCNQAMTFNKIHVSEQRNKFCKSEDCSLRDCAPFRHFDHSAKCLENQCVVKSIAKDDLDPGGKKWIKRFVHTKRHNFAKNRNEKPPVSFGAVGKPAQ